MYMSQYVYTCETMLYNKKMNTSILMLIPSCPHPALQITTNLSLHICFHLLEFYISGILQSIQYFVYLL